MSPQFKNITLYHVLTAFKYLSKYYSTEGFTLKYF